VQKCDRILQDHGPVRDLDHLSQTRRQPARVHLVVVLDAVRHRQPRTQHRLESANLANRQRLDCQSVSELNRAKIGERSAIARIEADADRLRPQIPGVSSIRHAERRDEPRIQGCRRPHQLEQMLFLVVEFAHRSQHAGRGIGCPRGGFSIDDGDRATGLCERVGNS
jgi:hypothetical protein